MALNYVHILELKNKMFIYLSQFKISIIKKNPHTLHTSHIVTQTLLPDTKEIQVPYTEVLLPHATESYIKNPGNTYFR